MGQIGALDPIKWQRTLEYLPNYIQGIEMTVAISAAALVIATLLGIITGVMRLSKKPYISGIATVYVEFVRNTPLLVQLFVVYFGLAPLWGGNRFIPMAMGLGLFAGAYVAEIVRAGIQSISKGQLEAALSCGMTGSQAMTLVILPQALRRILPALAGQFISLIKDSSLISVFGYTELTFAAKKVTSATFLGFHPYVLVAGFYLVICYPLSLAVRAFERRTARIG
jgi:polar amino acid transport system permease protein